MDNNLMVLIGALWALKAAFIFFWTPLAWIACAFFSWTIASDKQYSGGWWFVLGILFGPITLIAAAGLPNLSTIRVTVSGSGPASRKIEPVMSTDR